jgi:hypothetical protein
MLQPRQVSWWYWLVSAILLVPWIAGVEEAFWLLLGLTTLQIVHFRLREGRFAAFPVQVRIAYLLIVAVAAWPPMRWSALVPAVGTWVQVIFGYCLLARTLSLLPWNREEPLTWNLVWRTFAAPPTPGAVRQGLPALRTGSVP